MNDKKQRSDFDKGIIIDKPSFKSKTRNLSEWSMSIMGWLLWFFLLRPFILLVAWVLGYDIFYVQMYKLEGYKNLDRFFFFCVIIVSIYVVLRAWNIYNARKFRGKDRRKRAGNADSESMARFFETTPEQLNELQHCRSVDVVFMDDGRIRIESAELNKSINAKFDPQNQNEKLTVY